MEGGEGGEGKSRGKPRTNDSNFSLNVVVGSQLWDKKENMDLR